MVGEGSAKIKQKRRDERSRYAAARAGDAEEVLDRAGNADEPKQERI